MNRVRSAVVAALLLAPAVAAAAPQTARPNVYAPTYDVRLEILPDGSLDVTEKIAITVGAKPITWFDRTIPARRTDGFTAVAALMDGQSVPVTIRNRGDLKVRWDFSPTANATHTFEIRYRAVHVLSREVDGPRLVWTALPTRHTYPIDSAQVSVFAPTGSAATALSAEGGSVAPATPERPGVTIVGRGLARDRAITVRVTFDPNSIRPVEPQWFVDREEQIKMMPAWLAGAACLLVVGIGILVMMFAQLPRRPRGESAAFVAPADEGAVPPGLVALLLSRGEAGWSAMQAAFFRLVRDGYLVVEKRGDEGRRRSRAFDVTIGPAGGSLAAHESWIVDAVRHEPAPADLRTLMTRLTRRQRAFARVLMPDAVSRGWIDPERRRARSGLLATGFVLLVTALLCAMALQLIWPDLGPAPLSLPAVTFVVGLIYIFVSRVMSQVSAEGRREAERWRARVTELKAVIRNGVSGQSPADFDRWFPLAIGAGLGGAWLKAFAAELAASGSEIGWLRAMGSPADAAASLAMIVAISGASHAGGSGAGAAGGAGGGSSGAG